MVMIEKAFTVITPKLTKCQPKESCDDVKKLWEVYSYCYVPIDSQLISYYDTGIHFAGF